METTSPLLECRSISKYFGAMAAVKAISLDVMPGDVLGIGGPNGAGKTTLFEMISGLNSVDEGEIRFAGERIDGLPAHQICHRGIARIFQANAAFESLTARENVLVAAAFGCAVGAFPPMRFSAQARQAADGAIEFVGFRRSPDAAVRTLPVLDRKLLMIASALATNPRLVLLDEPVGGLNPEEIDQLMELVRKMIASGITIMLIEHVMRFLVQLSTRVVIMNQGEKIYEGPPAAIAEDELVRRIYLGEETSQKIRGYARNPSGGDNASNP